MSGCTQGPSPRGCTHSTVRGRLGRCVEGERNGRSPSVHLRQSCWCTRDGEWCERKVFRTAPCQHDEQSITSETPRIMTSSSTSTTVDSTRPEVSVLCKGCRSMRPIESFLCPVPDAGMLPNPPAVYSCALPSRPSTTRRIERICEPHDRCASGKVSASRARVVQPSCASYRERHCQTKRHQSDRRAPA